MLEGNRVKMDLSQDGRMELLAWLRWKEMKAGKGYTKSKISAYGPRRPVLQEKQDTQLQVYPQCQILTMLESQIHPKLIPDFVRWEVAMYIYCLICTGFRKWSQPFSEALSALSSSSSSHTHWVPLSLPLPTQDRVSLHSLSCPGTHNVVQVDLELTEILLPLPPKYWD